MLFDSKFKLTTSLSYINARAIIEAYLVHITFLSDWNAIVLVNEEALQGEEAVKGRRDLLIFLETSPN